jgi:iron complex outermembrane receptor protein
MQTNQFGRLIPGAGLLAILVALQPAPLRAQDAGENLSLGAIILKGEKVARDMMQTASSVSVISGEDIEKSRAGKDEIRTIIAGTPNVVYADNVSTPIIRGQNSEGPHNGANAFFAGAVPRATINLDGHYLSYNEFYFGATSAWDVESVEVFRGPQTTSQGANAIAGAIIVDTKDPTFSPEGAYRLEAGNYNQRRASLSWSGPINEQFAARISLDHSSRDTFIDYIGSTFVQNRIGQDFETNTARIKLLWAPTDISGLEVKLTYSHSEMARPSSEGASPDYEDLNSITTWMPGWEQTTQTAILDVDYDLGNRIKISNQTQFSTSDVARRVGTPTSGDANVDQNNYTNETKLSYGEADDQLSGVIGLYIAYTDQDEWLNQGGISTFHDQKHNLGLYGELSWRFAPQWTLTGGLRYQRDHIRRTGDVSQYFASSDIDYDHTFEKVLPKLSLAYAATPDWTIGAMISKGYNPGGVSLDFGGSKAWKEFDAETVWNYEVFTRANLLDDKLSLTGNLFYMDYSNAQHNLTKLIGSTSYYETYNVDEAESYGIELALDYRLIETLTLRAGLGLLHTEFKKFDALPQYEGNEFSRAPGKMLSLGAAWDATEQLSIGGQIRYIDGYYSNTANSPAYAVNGYALVDVQASYTVRESFEVYGYVNNIFDKRSPTLLEAARGDVAFTQASMTSPRMFGIGIRGRF